MNVSGNHAGFLLLLISLNVLAVTLDLATTWYAFTKYPENFLSAHGFFSSHQELVETRVLGYQPLINFSVFLGFTVLAFLTFQLSHASSLYPHLVTLFVACLPFIAVIWNVSVMLLVR